MPDNNSDVSPICSKQQQRQARRLPSAKRLSFQKRKTTQKTPDPPDWGAAGRSLADSRSRSRIHSIWRIWWMATSSQPNNRCFLTVICGQLDLLFGCKVKIYFLVSCTCHKDIEVYSVNVLELKRGSNFEGTCRWKWSVPSLLQRSQCWRWCRASR